MKQIEFQTVVYPSRGDIAYAADSAWGQVSIAAKTITIIVNQYTIKLKTSDFYRALSRDVKRDAELFLDILDFDKISEPDVKIIINSGKSKRTIITDKSKKLWPERTIANTDKMSVTFPRKDKNVFMLSFKKDPQKFEFKDKRIFLRLINDLTK